MIIKDIQRARSRTEMTIQKRVIVAIFIFSGFFLGFACDDNADGDADTDVDADSDADSDTDSDADGDPITIDDPLFTEFTETVAEWITPEWYTCEQEQSACGLPCSDGDLWVAINERDFRDSRLCSSCMYVEGPLGEITVELIENCGGACVDGEIELSRSAFEAIADLEEGRADVRWKLVPCERSGPISFSYEPDSHEWWAGIQVRNPALPVASLSIRYTGEDGWIELERDGWNHFPISADLGDGPFDFIVTAIDGQELREKGIPYVPGSTFEGTGQFEISQ